MRISSKGPSTFGQRTPALAGMPPPCPRRRTRRPPTSATVRRFPRRRSRQAGRSEATAGDPGSRGRYWHGPGRIAGSARVMPVAARAEIASCHLASLRSGGSPPQRDRPSLALDEEERLGEPVVLDGTRVAELAGDRHAVAHRHQSPWRRPRPGCRTDTARPAVQRVGLAEEEPRDVQDVAPHIREDTAPGPSGTAGCQRRESC